MIKGGKRQNSLFISMKKVNFDPLIHISSGQNIKKSIIIGIFNSISIEEGSLSSEIYEHVEISSTNKSLIYCDGHFLIKSPVRSETIHARYKKVKSQLIDNNLKSLKIKG